MARAAPNCKKLYLKIFAAAAIIYEMEAIYV